MSLKPIFFVLLGVLCFPGYLCPEGSSEKGLKEQPPLWNAAGEWARSRVSEHINDVEEKIQTQFGDTYRHGGFVVDLKKAFPAEYSDEAVPLTDEVKAGAAYELEKAAKKGAELLFNWVFLAKSPNIGQDFAKLTDVIDLLVFSACDKKEECVDPSNTPIVLRGRLAELAYQLFSGFAAGKDESGYLFETAKASGGRKNMLIQFRESGKQRATRLRYLGNPKVKALFVGSTVREKAKKSSLSLTLFFVEAHQMFSGWTTRIVGKTALPDSAALKTLYKNRVVLRLNDVLRTIVKLQLSAENSKSFKISNAWTMFTRAFNAARYLQKERTNLDDAVYEKYVAALRDVVKKIEEDGIFVKQGTYSKKALSYLKKRVEKLAS
ncbi:MAG: hypothetical protein M1549_01045 [Candidatus Dependentiae bacterium]|nr:hypothetical protein [Candidatus Dependentiae bacterium]